MPFTLFHLGPGMVFKAVLQQRFSIISFAIAQVAMDIEPLVGMIRGAERLHGITHTYLAAILIAVPVALFTPIVCRPLLRRWQHEVIYYQLPWVLTPLQFTPIAVINGAWLGTLSHVLLDSVMHSEMTPLAPWVMNNTIYHWLSITALHHLCIISGLLGLTGWLWWQWWQFRRNG
ncbi:DUF4184 family protein [Rhodoferax sp. 4810]|uniref:DUF4184 family protein n=1 Tax=Thiospirillum jenense TaxID=1653858 RepID=A0A839HC76_9GAMM|nr:DUF4184 family protein [Thiospirillum jenense]MBB1076317.1 DUF4184 family protein [Rhodoferax jenense]MBB1126271.1 DUF4184 family protein [Thiospirillum jenense]